MIEKPDFVPTCIDFVWEMGLSKIRDQIEMFDALDSKVGVIVGFVVVSIVEILGFLILAAVEAPPAQFQNGSPAFSKAVEVCFGLGLILSLLSTLFGLLALQVRKFAIGFDYGKLVAGASLELGELKAVFLDDVLKSVQENGAVLDTKVKYARWANLFVLASLLCYTIVVAMLFMCFVPRG